VWCPPFLPTLQTPRTLVILGLVPVSENKTENHVPTFLNHLPDIINRVFDILELLVVRVTILGLAVLGAYALFQHHV
jgi:hypothetical protein